MHDISKSWYLKILAVEAEREDLMAGMMTLMSAHGQVSRERAELESAAGALQRLGSLIATVEDRNKKLSRESGDLWQAIMDLDGKELTSEEIEREESVIAEALRWLERIKAETSEGGGP